MLIVHTPPGYPSPRKWHVLTEEGKFIRAFWTREGAERFIKQAEEETDGIGI